MVGLPAGMQREDDLPRDDRVIDEPIGEVVMDHRDLLEQRLEMW